MKPSVDGALTARQKALLTTRERGRTLVADGYLVLSIEQEPGRYFVQRPEPKRLADGRVIVGYQVDLTEGNATCECDCFRELGDCKHRIATLIEVARAMRLLGPMLPTAIAVRLSGVMPVSPSTNAVAALPCTNAVAALPSGEVIGYEVRRCDRNELIQAILLSDNEAAQADAETTADLWRKRMPHADFAVVPIVEPQQRTVAGDVTMGRPRMRGLDRAREDWND